MKRYKSIFKEEKKVMKEGVEESLDSLLQKYIHGYGGPGVQNTNQYFNVITRILHLVSTNLNDVLHDDTDAFSSNDKMKAKKMLNFTLYTFSR